MPATGAGAEVFLLDVTEGAGDDIRALCLVQNIMITLYTWCGIWSDNLVGLRGILVVAPSILIRVGRNASNQNKVRPNQGPEQRP